MTIDDRIREHMRLVLYAKSKLYRRGVPWYVEEDDMIAAGLVGLWKAIERYEESRGTAFSTFALPYVYGHMLNEIRRAARAYHQDLSLDSYVRGTELRWEDILEARPDEDHLFAEELLRRLTPRERWIVARRYQGYTYQEIAREMGCSAPRVWQLVRRIRTKAR